MTRYDRLDAQSLEIAVKGLTGWTIEDEKLKREFKFKNFSEAFAFMARVALDAHLLDHHPEWSNVYNRVRIDLLTHDAGEITSLDIDLAEYDQLVLMAAGYNSSQVCFGTGTCSVSPGDGRTIF